MRKTFYITLLYLTLGGGIYSNCHSNEATPIQIALVGPLSGPYAAYGSQLLAAATQAALDLNSHGGINGVPIEIMPFDDQCDADLALAVAEQIIQSSNYQAVIGHVCSAPSLATAKLYSRAKILVISPTATNPKLTSHNINTQFRMSGNDQQQSLVAANFIAYTLQSKRIAVLHDDQLYSKDLADLVSEHLLFLNAAPAMYQAIPRGTRNFTTLVKKLKHLQIDAIYFAGLYTEVAALANALSILQLQIPLVSADGLAIEQFVQAVHDPSVATSIMLSFSADPQALVSSRQPIKQMHANNFSTTGYPLYAYASVQVIAAAIQNTNKLDGEALANWLHYHTVDTVLGKKSWDTNGDIIDNDFKMYAWQPQKDQLVLKPILR